MGIYSNTLSGLSGLGLGEAAAAAKAKRIHQRILKRICNYIDIITNPFLEAVNEGEIGGTDTEIPDIVIWSLDKNFETQNPLIAIEITTSEYQKENTDKLRDLFFKYPTLQECFLFNYELGKWFEIIKTGGTIENSESGYLSKQFNQKCNFNEPLKNSYIKDLFGIEKRKRNRQ